MDPIEEMLIERACVRLVTDYCHLVDHGEASRIADLFTEDGIFIGVEGRDALRSFFATRENNCAGMSRHVCNNTLIDAIDPDSARGVTYLTLYRDDGEPGRLVSPLEGPMLAGEYRDEFTRTSEGWCRSPRQLVIDFTRPGFEP